MLKKLAAFFETQQQNHVMISIKTSPGFSPGFSNLDLAALVLT
jgi:hypothetical protein